MIRYDFCFWLKITGFFLDSDSFCLHGYWFNSVQSNRMCVQPDDLDTWTALIEGVWMNYNWFSFDSRSFGEFFTKANTSLLSLSPEWLTHRVFSDKVPRLFVTLSYFRPDGFVQLLSLIPILILLLYLLVSIDLVHTGICEIRYEEIFWRRATVC